MNILLDTHAFIWADNDSQKLSGNAIGAILQATTKYVSIVSVWEIQIKSSLGKLPLTKPLAKLVLDQQEQNGVQILPITQDHIYALTDLPPIHRDPFDRMLIAQAQHEHLTLVTADENIPKYAVHTAW